jgi:hypothetical protein
MDSLPQWDALSEAARSQLMEGVHAMLAADVRCMTNVGSDATWHELLAAGVVQTTPDSGGIRPHGTRRMSHSGCHGGQPHLTCAARRLTFDPYRRKNGPRSLR